MLKLQLNSWPLAWLRESRVVQEGGSRVLLLQRDAWPVARLVESRGVPEGDFFF